MTVHRGTCPLHRKAAHEAALGPADQRRSRRLRRSYMASVVRTPIFPAMTRLPAAIAAVALPSERDLDVVFAAVDWALEEARARGAELVVFPECALGGYLREPDADEPAGPVLPPALDPDGPEIRRLIEAAGDTVVCIGLHRGRRRTAPYTSAVCVSGDGILGHHRKVHLPPAERFAYSAGEGFAAFDTPVGRLGMLICYDKLFPEAARALALDGAGIDRLRCRRGRWTGTTRARTRRSTSRCATSTCSTSRARGREPGRLGLDQPDRPARARCASSATRRSSTRRAPCARTPAPTRASRSRASTPDAIEVARAFIDHLGDRRPAPTGRWRRSRCVSSCPPGRAVLMCGIVAAHGGADPAELERMLERIAHRGPDDTRHRSRSAARWLGHRRLSIVDVEGGAAAARSTAEGDALARRQRRGLQPRARARPARRPRASLTDSDNEVALHLLDEHGPESLAPAQRHVRVRGARPTTAASSPPATPSASSRCTGPHAATARCASPREMHAFDPDWQAATSSRSRPAAAWTPEDGLVRFAAAVPEDRSSRCRPRTDLRAGTREVLVARGRAPDDGRRARRRVPLRRAGLLARRRDRRRAAYARRGDAAADVRGRHRRTRPTCWPRGASPSTSAPSTTRRIYTRRGGARRRCRTSCARSSPSTRALVRSAVPNYLLAAA